MSQSPVARQAMASGNPSSPKPVPKLRKPTKRISVKNQVQQNDDDDDDEPQLIMSPVIASVAVKAEDSDSDSISSSPANVESPILDKVSLRRGSVHNNSANNVISGSPSMITISQRTKEEDDAAVIICDANNNDNSAAAQDQDKPKSNSMRLKKKDSNQAPLAFLKGLPSAQKQAELKNLPEPAKLQPEVGSPTVTRKSVGSNNPLNVNLNNLPSNQSAVSQSAAVQQAPCINLSNLDENIKTVIPLSEAERKEFYPSDDDEDFDNYLFDLVQKESEEEAKLTESLKFTEYFKNPLFDASAPPSKEVFVQLTRDDCIRLNEVARRARERGDKNFTNYKLIDKLDKELLKEFKTKQMTRRLSTMTMMRRSEKNAPINLKDIRELEDLRRGSDAGFGIDDEAISSKVSGKYDIRKCSRSWKTQLQKIQGETGNAAEKRQSADVNNETKKKIHFSSHASVLRQGYMPEWKYTLHCKRLLDANKEKIAQKTV